MALGGGRRDGGVVSGSENGGVNGRSGFYSDRRGDGDVREGGARRGGGVDGGGDDDGVDGRSGSNGDGRRDSGGGDDDVGGGGGDSAADGTISNGPARRLRLGLLPGTPVREWSAGGGFMCNGLPIGSPDYVLQTLQSKLETSVADAADALVALSRLSIQERCLLLLFCINSKAIHILRGVPPSAGLETAEIIDAKIIDTYAHITFTAPALLRADHPNQALQQLRFPPSHGGPGLTSLVYTYPAAYVGSFANCLANLRSFEPIAETIAEGTAAEWPDQGAGPKGCRTGPLPDIDRAWHHGLECGDDAPLFALPQIRVITAFHDDNDTPDLNKLSRAPKHAQAVLSRALTQYRFDRIVNNSDVDPYARARLKVCCGYGSGDWLRVLPINDTHFTDPQYLVALSLCLGLPIKAIGPNTTCLRTCPTAATRDSPPLADAHKWSFGDHFFWCPAGSKLEGKTNCLARHNAIVKVLISMLREVFGYTCCDSQRGQALSINDSKRVDFSAESLSRRPLPRACDVTVLHPFTTSHLAAALACGADFLNTAGDSAKEKKHGADARAAGYDFFPASFASTGAWGPGIKKWFQELWGEKFKEAEADHEPTDPIARQMLHWRARVSACIQRANGQMLLSRACHQDIACPDHTACARASCLPDASHYGRAGLAHNRTLSTLRRAQRAA